MILRQFITGFAELTPGNGSWRIKTLIPFTAAASQYMDMIAAAGAFKHSGDQEFVDSQGFPAYGALTGAIFFQAKMAAPDVHEPVPASRERRVGMGIDQLAFVQNSGTDGAYLGVTWLAAFLFMPFLSWPGCGTG